MRALFQFFIPFGLFIAVLLTPIYLRRDFEDDKSDKIIDSYTGVLDGLTTISSKIYSSETTPHTEIKTTEALTTRSSTTTTTATSKATSAREMTN